MTGHGGFLRENVPLVAAVSLPLAVVGLFLLASAIPRWFVPPPAYDLVLVRVEGYDQARPRVAVDIAVRDGLVEATARGVPANSYPQVLSLFLFEHQTMNVREIPFDLPAWLSETDPPVNVAIPALAGRRVVAQAKAPDGYELRTRDRQRTGLFGELFGMSAGADRVSLVNKGRAVPISLQSNRYAYSVSAVGWVVNEGSH